MKHVMTMALIATAMLAAPAGHADPDPHKPDVGANYCPGGAGVGGQRPREPYCDGVPYPDGSYWHAIKRGASGRPSSWCSASCPLRRQVPSPVLCRRYRPGRYPHRLAAALGIDPAGFWSVAPTIQLFVSSFPALHLFPFLCGAGRAH